MELQDKIKNLYYSEINIGEMIKSTKKHYKWSFDYNFNNYLIEMYDSKLSGKKRLLIDGKLVKEIEE